MPKLKIKDLRAQLDRAFRVCASKTELEFGPLQFHEIQVKQLQHKGEPFYQYQLDLKVLMTKEGKTTLVNLHGIVAQRLKELTFKQGMMECYTAMIDFLLSDGGMERKFRKVFIEP